MNGDSNHIFRTSALDGQPLDSRPPRFTWTLFAAQLWLLAAFVGMSLFAVAAKLLLTGPNEARPTAVLVLGLLGAVLAPVAWWNLACHIARAERETRATDAEPAAATAPTPIAPAKPLLLSSHR